MTASITSTYVLGGESLQIAYQSQEDWKRYHAAIQHLEIPASENLEEHALHLLVATLDSHWRESLPEVVIQAFETASSERSSQFLFRDEEVSLCIQYRDTIECIQCYCKQEKKAYFFANQSTQNELLTAPFRTVFAWFLEDRQKLLLHAAGFSDADRGILVAGKSGVGKTNFSLYAHGAGYTFLGDDTVCCDLNTPTTIHSLYNTVRIHESDKESFTALFHAPLHQNDSKWYAHIDSSIHPGGQRLKAILLPTSDMNACSCEPVSAFHALKAIAPSTLLHVPGYERAGSLVSALVQIVPAYRVKQPSSFNDVHAILQSLYAMNE